MQRNDLIEQLSYAVTRASIESEKTIARFESIKDALDYSKVMKLKYSAFSFRVYFEFYCEETGNLLVHPWNKQPGA